MPIKNNIYLLFYLLLSPYGLFAQKTSSDSLKIVTSINEAFALRQSHPDSALQISEQALQLAELGRDTKNLVNLWRIKGLVHYGQHRTEQALNCFQQSYDFAKQIKHRESRLLINLGNVYYQQQAYERAKEKYQLAIDVSAKEDTLLSIDALNNLGSIHISMGKYEAALTYYQQSLGLQQAIDRIQLPTYINMAQTYDRLNQFEKGVATYEMAKELAQSRKDTTLLVIVYRRMGNLLKKQGVYAKSIQIFQKALVLQQLINHQRGIANTLQGIGVVFYEQKNYESSLDYLNQSLAISITENDFLRQAIVLDFIGKNYKEQTLYAQALIAFQQAKEIAEQKKFKKNLMFPLYSIGDTYERLNQLDSANLYLNQANNFAKSYNQNTLKAAIQTSLGKIANKRGKSEAALTHFKQAIRVSKANRRKKEEAEASKLLAVLLKEQKKDKEALFYLERYLALQDTLFNEENTRKITELEANHQFEKEKQDLLYQNEVEKQKLATEIQRQRAWQLVLGIALALSLIALFFYRRAQRLNAKINAQQLQYEQKERERLEEMDTFKSRFFTNIAHELRTPLTLILEPVNRLLKNNAKNNQQSMLQLIKDNAHLLLGRVNEILDLAKIEADAIDLQPTPTNFYEFIQILIGNFENQAQQKSQELNLNYQLEKELTILVDQSKFQHIFNNYLSNALKFTPEGGQIAVSLSTIQTAAQSLNLLLAVKDNGRGIPDKDLPHIFNRFYQSDANGENYAGAGIGLALSKEMAILMQGKVDVKSQQGLGSIFSFQFPFEEVASKVNTTQSAEMATDSEPLDQMTANSEKSSTILVVEDNPQLNDYLQLILSEKYHVISAKNGQVALEKLETNSCDLILSDIMMPVMDGFELLEKLKNSDEYCHLPVIMLTAKGEPSDKLKALRIGVDDYLIKPFEEEVLLTSIQHLLGNQNNRTTEETPTVVEKKKIATSITNADLKWLATVEVILQKELSNSQFTFDLLAKQLFISKSQLQRRLKKVTGLTPNKYFREIRLQTARKLLESGKARTVSEVAYAVGFETPKYFVKIYQERFGKHPKTDL